MATDPPDGKGESSAPEPTMSQMMEVAKAGQKAAEEAKTAAEARSTVATAVEQEAEEQGLHLSDEEAKKIASITITELESRGAFGPPAQETPPPPPEGDPAAGDGPVAPPTPEGSTEPPSGAEPGADEPPVKRSWAERFQGK